MGGVTIIVDTLTFWWGKWQNFFFHLAIGTLYLLIGTLFIKNLLTISISLTLLLAFLYVFLGSMRIAYSLFFKLPGWELGFINGAITLILGILIVVEWPQSSLFILGTFIGIDLFSVGLSYITMALSSRNRLENRIS